MRKVQNSIIGLMPRSHAKSQQWVTSQPAERAADKHFERVCQYNPVIYEPVRMDSLVWRRCRLTPLPCLTHFYQAPKISAAAPYTITVYTHDARTFPSNIERHMLNGTALSLALLSIPHPSPHPPSPTPNPIPQTPNPKHSTLKHSLSQFYQAVENALPHTPYTPPHT